MLEAPPATPPTARLPLGRLIGRSVIDVATHLTSLIMLAAPWIALDWSVYQAMAWMFGFEAAYGVTVAVVNIIAVSVISVAWHRHVLLDEPLPRFSPINARVLRYGLFYGAFVLAWWLAGKVLEGAGSALGLIVLPLGAVVMFVAAARLAMVFPGVAIDHRGMSFARAWTITRGCSWRLFAGQGVLVLIVLVPALSVVAISPIGLREVAESDSPSVGLSLFNLGYTIAYHLIMVLCTAFLSFAYRHVAEHQATDDRQEAAAT